MAYLPSTVSPLDAAKVRERTEHYIRINKLRAQIHDVVAPVLKTFDGKVPSKRMANAVEKAIKAAFPEHNFSVSWVTEYSWYAIRIWNGTTLTWSDHYDTTVVYKSDGPYSHEKWLEKHQQYGYHLHAEKAERALPGLEERVAQYNDALAVLEQAYTNLDNLVKS